MGGTQERLEPGLHEAGPAGRSSRPIGQSKSRPPDADPVQPLQAQPPALRVDGAVSQCRQTRGLASSGREPRPQPQLLGSPHGERVDRRAHRAGDLERRGGGEELVDPVRGAGRSQRVGAPRLRLRSTTAAVAMSVVAAVLPPIAVLIANWGEDH